MAHDERQGICLGTPIEVAESALLSRKQPRTSRAPRVWEQIVTDERGRRRLHGAFTGGFSAGYFNTVATKGGFTPRAFRTSRTQRAEETAQKVQDFYDEDELEEERRVDIATQDVYDTFATERNERARERTEKEAHARPIIPGEIISEFVEGVSESIGVKLLQRMGWRQGKGIGESFQQSRDLKWGPDASLLQQSSTVWKEKAKMNVHGLGFDPFRGSSAFERHKTGKTAPHPTAKRSRGIAFGVGVLEETDTFGEVGDYVEAMHDGMNYYDVSDHSDDDKSSRKREQKVKRLGHKALHGRESFVAGFHLGTVLHEMKLFELPVVPPEFVERHQESMQQRDQNSTAASQATVPTPHFPAEEELKRRIDSVAVFVAKGGVMSEELARQEHMNDEAFSFLFGGDGSEYYRWKLLDVKVTFQKLGVKCSGLREAPLTADDRGFILGDEKIREQQPLQSKAVSHPFIQGVPEADRSRVKSALNSTFVKGTTEGVLHVDQRESGLRAFRPKDMQQVEEVAPEKQLPQPAELTPVRTFIDWHAVPLLYKRFNVLDPLKGMPRESEPKSKFMSYESALDDAKADDPVTAVTDAPTVSIADEIDTTQPPPEYTEPPLDIFKSIFDTASDEEDEGDAQQQGPKQPEKEAEKEQRIARAPVNKMPEAETKSGGRKRLNITSDESEEEESSNDHRLKKEKKKKSRKEQEEEFDESVLSGLSTSEFKKLLKTLKKSRAKKRAKKEEKHKRHRDTRAERRSSKS